MLKKIILGSLLVLPVSNHAITLSQGWFYTGLTSIVLKHFENEAAQKSSVILMRVAVAFFALRCAKPLFEVKKVEDTILQPSSN